MFIKTGMKFWPRLVAVCVLCLLSLTVYLHLPDSQTSPRPQALAGDLWSPHKLHGRAFRPPANAKGDRKMCSLQSGPAHYANTSTFDLYQNTQFNLKSDGEWETPLVESFKVGREAFRPPKLTVVLLPHSHNDPGWLKTVTEYYSDQTKHILTNMVNKLTQYPNMTFVWAETVYLNMWWNELDDGVKVHVRRLIRRGQLEIALGGWVMPDEASTHYVSVIDQLVEGHQWLWENLRVRPQTSWSIDPFGHSGTMPYLWKKAGMENMVTGRIHQAIKGSLMERRSLEFLWRQMWDTAGHSDILCHVLPFMLYNIKYSCGPNPSACLHFDFRRVEGDWSESLAEEITEESLPQVADLLYRQYRDKSQYFEYQTILVPIGDDFRYDREIEWDQQYTNYEKLIQYINSRKRQWNMHVQWGTLKDYFQLVKQEFASRKRQNPRVTFPVVSGDFFPYSDRDNAYWTGYYTTRPFDKQFSRDVQMNLQAADILNTLCFAYYKKWGIEPDSRFFQHSNFLQRARRSLGLFLHHDAITGTSKDFVVRDYEGYLAEAYNQTQDVMKMTLQALLSRGKVETPVVFRPSMARPHAQSRALRQVIPAKTAGTNLVFFNPLGQGRIDLVHIVVDTPYVEAMSASYDHLPVQISPVWQGDLEDDATVRTDQFLASFMLELPPLAIEPVILYRKSYLPSSAHAASVGVYNSETMDVAPDAPFEQSRPEPKPLQPILVDNGVIQLEINQKTGFILSLKDLTTTNVTKLDFGLEYYKSQGSGAYIFYPKGPSMPLFYSTPVIKVFKGPLLTSVEISFDPYLTQVISLHHYPDHLTSAVFIENTLNMQTLKDKEVIMTFQTDIDNEDSAYFTDQNGFQFIRRKPNPALSIEANYYPMTSGVFMEDELKRLTLLCAQPHGVSSLDKGALEIMLDRQLLYDDNRGMGEGVTDNKPTVSKFILLVEPRSSPRPSPHSSHFSSLSMLGLNLNDLLQTPVQTFYTSIESDVFFHPLRPLSSSLPCDTSLTSLRSLATSKLSYNGTSLILHRRGYDCEFPITPPLCLPSDPSVSLGGLFEEFNFANVRETSLTHTIVTRPISPSEKLTIAPMEIAAFHLRF